MCGLNDCCGYSEDGTVPDGFVNVDEVDADGMCGLNDWVDVHRMALFEMGLGMLMKMMLMLMVHH